MGPTDVPVAAAVVENADTAEEEANVSPVCPNALTFQIEKYITRGETKFVSPLLMYFLI